MARIIHSGYVLSIESVGLPIIMGRYMVKQSHTYIILYVDTTYTLMKNNIYKCQRGIIYIGGICIIVICIVKHIMPQHYMVMHTPCLHTLYIERTTYI